VNLETASFLLDLNRQFYQTFAVHFSATRQRLQPGVLRLLPDLLDSASLLDLGCGNGELARELGRRGLAGRYIGLDFSSGLLELIQQNLPEGLRASFIQADLSLPGWDALLTGQAFDAILAFAVLHHLPGADLRLQVLRQVSGLLSLSGVFIHSNWQFMNSARLRRRIQPWEAAGLTADDVDPGDYLLDWKSGGTGLRYVHLFSLEELAALAQEAGFRILQTFFSDGENSRLGLYQVWQRLG
jgi:tRNA (uracil-5-)-methyltransferase TRM9